MKIAECFSSFCYKNVAFYIFSLFISSGTKVDARDSGGCSPWTVEELEQIKRIGNPMRLKQRSLKYNQKKWVIFFLEELESNDSFMEFSLLGRRVKK